MIRVAIVGLGGISAAHIQAYLTFPERCRIVALVDIVPEKARKRAEEYGISCDILDDHHLLLDRRDIDLVDICTPPYVHAEISVNCLRAGMNVLCEKPMAASLEECDQVLAAARESGKLFSSIAQNRFRTPIAAFKAGKAFPGGFLLVAGALLLRHVVAGHLGKGRRRLHPEPRRPSHRHAVLDDGPAPGGGQRIG